MAEVKAEIKGTNLVLTIPINKPMTKSASGKSLVLATTNGNQVTDLDVEGKKLTVGINAYVKV